MLTIYEISAKQICAGLLELNLTNTIILKNNPVIFIWKNPQNIWTNALNNSTYSVMFRTNLGLFMINPVKIGTNQVILKTKLELYKTNSAIIGTNSVICTTNLVLFWMNPPISRTNLNILRTNQVTV